MDGIAMPEALERWPVARLVPYANNPRTHSPAQVDQIAASIREFGFTNPVLVDEAGGIIAGHGRVMAAQALGLTEVPVIRLGHLTETQRRAYVIADNRIALNAGWDEELLAAELAALDLDAFDLELTGFPMAEVDALLARFEAGEDERAAREAVPETPEVPVTRPGDLWLMGAHLVLCGDATRPEDYRVVLEGGLADMVFTDPPYNVGYAGGPREARSGKGRKILNDDMGDAFGAFLQTVCANMIAVTKGALYIAMSSSELATLQTAFIASGGHWSTFIIWSKNHFTLGRADYQRQFEAILYGWPEGSDHYWCGARDQGDVWHHAKPAANDLHPTMKPVALVEQAVRNSSKSRDLVLDPFAGSGTTAIACEALGRSARLIELDPRYCDVIVRRWQDYAVRDALLAGTTDTFDMVAEQRRG